MFVGEVFWSCAGRSFFEILGDTFDARENFLLPTGQISVISKVYEHCLRLGIHVHSLLQDGGKILFSVEQHDFSKQPRRYWGAFTWPNKQR